MVAAAKRRSTPSKTRLAQGLRRQLEAAKRDRTPRRFYENVRESFALGHLRFEEISPSEIFAQTVPGGREIVNAVRAYDEQELAYLMESDAVNTGDFVKIVTLAITGTIEAMDLPTLLQDRLATVRTTNFDRERYTGIGELGDQAEVVNEGQPYPLAGVGPHWQDTPITKKRGFTVGITKEAVFFDRTGQVVQRCQDVIKWMQVNKEKRIMAMVAGNVNTYNWDGDYFDTYLNGAGSDPYDNVSGGNPFVNHKSIETVETLRAELRSPDTDEPLDLGDETLVLGPPALKPSFSRVLGANEIRRTDGDTVTIGPNPVSQYQWLTSGYLRDAQGDNTTWYIGDPKKAFEYIQNWGITPQTAGANSEMDFTNDIVLRFKASERATEHVKEPRYMNKCTI